MKTNRNRNNLFLPLIISLVVLLLNFWFIYDQLKDGFSYKILFPIAWCLFCIFWFFRFLDQYKKAGAEKE